ESRALVEFLLDCLDHGRVTVTRHQSAEAKIVVNVFVAVDVVNPAAFAVFDKNGIRLVVAVNSGYAPGNALLGAPVRGGRPRRALLVKRQLFFECFVRHGISPNQERRLSVGAPLAGLFPAVSVLPKKVVFFRTNGSAARNSRASELLL